MALAQHITRDIERTHAEEVIFKKIQNLMERTEQKVLVYHKKNTQISKLRFSLKKGEKYISLYSTPQHFRPGLSNLG